MKNLIIVLGVFFSCGIHAQDKKMCITVDDLPTVAYGLDDVQSKQGLTNELIQVFVDYDIPAIGYVNEGKLYKNDQLDSLEVKLLALWLSNGLELGNHTFSHSNYHTVSFETFTNDVLKGERIIKNLANEYGSDIKYFRHPYLRMGLRKTHADSLNIFLKAHGYIVAPVTIDNDDYMFAAVYSKALKSKDSVMMERIGADYVKYMEGKLVFYEQQSKKLFGRNIGQTLLIHASHLNAHFIDELVEMYRKHNYTFVSQTEILKDPAYSEEITEYGNWGISWLDRWALSQGEKGAFFAGEPQTPKYIRDKFK